MIIYIFVFKYINFWMKSNKNKYYIYEIQTVSYFSIRNIIEHFSIGQIWIISFSYIEFSFNNFGLRSFLSCIYINMIRFICTIWHLFRRDKFYSTPSNHSFQRRLKNYKFCSIYFMLEDLKYFLCNQFFFNCCFVFYRIRILETFYTNNTGIFF